MGKTETSIEAEQLHISTELLRALCHPLRMRILHFIDQNDNINVNKIYNTLKLEQSITSQHLRILRKSNIVSTERDGKFIFYHINYDKVGSMIKIIRNFLIEEDEYQKKKKEA